MPLCLVILQSCLVKCRVWQEPKRSLPHVLLPQIVKYSRLLVGVKFSHCGSHYVLSNLSRRVVPVAKGSFMQYIGICGSRENYRMWRIFSLSKYLCFLFSRDSSEFQKSHFTYVTCMVPMKKHQMYLKDSKPCHQWPMHANLNPFWNEPNGIHKFSKQNTRYTCANSHITWHTWFPWRHRMWMI